MDGPTRRYPRVNKLCLIAYVNRDGSEQRTPVSLGRVLDLSPAGIGMELFAPVEVGSFMEMELDLQERLLPVQGRVVNVRSAEEGRYVVGIEFTEPREELAGFVAAP
jgi:hypothetical protein